MTDEDWMRRALWLAERGRGFVEPNPLVGAVVVAGGQLVGEGWHQVFGQSHAEINALRQAGEQARGATLYVTLEPCCHHGKTPPCTDAILAAGISRVVAALHDPFPAVAGQGERLLREAGLQIEMGLCEAEARRLNAPYLKLIGTGKPYVILKWAMTLDGKIATRTGDSKWISGPESRQCVHQLRGRVDAIVVGLGTVLADDPQLTARPPGPRVATRIVLDSRGRIPLSTRLVQTAREFPTIIATCAAHGNRDWDRLREAGCQVLPLPGTGRPPVLALLAELGRRRMTNVLVEGGSEVLAAFVEARAADEVQVFLAPRLAGGSKAPGPIGGLGIEQIAEALPVAEWEVQPLGPDLFLRGRLAPELLPAPGVS